MPTPITKTYDMLKIKGVKGWIRDSWARRKITALQDTQGYGVKGFSFTYTVTAGGTIKITANDFGITDYTGYHRLCLRSVSSGSGNAVVVETYANASGNYAVLTLRNVSGSSVTATATISVLYTKQALTSL